MIRISTSGLRDLPVLRVHHARVCVVEDTDPTPPDQISWCKVVRAPSRPFGQKTNLLSHHHQGFGIVT
jgi:hypothetical protein